MKESLPHTSHRQTVPLKTRVGWGFGGLADNYIMNALNALFLILYVQYFKMPPVLAGLALAVPRFFDAITDPMIGNLSDNSRSRFGRRKPFMVVGVILSAVLLPLFWMPVGAESASNPDWWKNGLFLYAAVLGMIYALTYTLFVVPYTALGYELTPDYDERTRVLAWRMYIGLLGSMTVPLFYRLVQLDRFGNEARGAVIISLGIGIIIILCGLIPVWVCPENKQVQKQEQIPFFRAMKESLTNRAYLILLVSYIIIIVALFSAGTLGGFLNIYYICGGNKDFAGVLMGTAGVMGALVSYGSMFLLTAVSTRFEKKVAMLLGLALALISSASIWFTYNPRWPMLQLVSILIGSLGLQGCWLMVSSMTADICDEDELKTGLRREAMFGAVEGLALKGALAFTAVLGGILLQISGFDAERVDQFEEQTLSAAVRPVRGWEIPEGPFAAATENFLVAGDKLELISNDQSAVEEGSRWTVIWRLLRGENLYFRWYEFEEALEIYLAAGEAYVASLPEADPFSEEFSTYRANAEQEFVHDFGEQKSVSQRMKGMVVVFQVIGLGIAAMIMLAYPITRKRSEETRRQLDARHAASEAAL
jgi:GPH family glycoside/pentoside/hexuronide:cation symporter